MPSSLWNHQKLQPIHQTPSEYLIVHYTQITPPTQITTPPTDIIKLTEHI